MKLTKKEKRKVDYWGTTVKERQFMYHWTLPENQRPPTWATMRRLMGLKSNQSVKEYLKRLQKKGLL